MKRILITAIAIILFTAMILCAGCSQYADPKLDITSSFEKNSEDPSTGNITYDITVTIANTGENNAYQVNLLTILSTPRDLPEYRFTSTTFTVGDVLKGTRQTLNQQVILPATKTNYDLIISGTRTPEIETKITSVSSSVMG